MPEKFVWSFAKTVAFGSFAGASPGLLFSIPVGATLLFGEYGSWAAVPIMLFPLLIAVPFVLGGSLIIGVPATLLLSRHGKEQPEVYVVLGALSGAIVLPGYFLLDGSRLGYWTALLAAYGALIGGATGWHWGAGRERLAEQALTPAAAGASG